jgi:hypothetical protein
LRIVGHLLLCYLLLAIRYSLFANRCRLHHPARAKIFATRGCFRVDDNR